jgi:DNA-binding NtrC family response regulator
VDVRVIAATRRDLEGLVSEGAFRQDLFFRLNVFFVRVPPLRERRDDILPLARHFLRKYAALYGRQEVGLSGEAKHLLVSYRWPGNVRELENVLERAAVLVREGTIGAEELPPQLMASEEDLLEAALRDRMSLEELSAAYIRRVLRLAGGNKSKAAKILGINRKTLLEKRRRFGID